MQRVLITVAACLLFAGSAHARGPVEILNHATGIGVGVTTKVLNEVDNITTNLLSNNELKLSDIVIGSENELLNENFSKNGVDILNGEKTGISTC